MCVPSPQSKKLGISGLKYPVTISSFGSITIGCENKSINEWEITEQREIIKMGGKDGLIFWLKYKKPILDMAREFYLECQQPAESATA